MCASDESSSPIYRPAPRSSLRPSTMFTMSTACRGSWGGRFMAAKAAWALPSHRSWRRLIAAADDGEIAFGSSLVRDRFWFLSFCSFVLLPSTEESAGNCSGNSSQRETGRHSRRWWSHFKRLQLGCMPQSATPSLDPPCEAERDLRPCLDLARLLGPSPLSTF